MGWAWFLNVLQLLSSLLAVIGFIKGRKKITDSPFTVFPIDNIFNELSAPLNDTPDYYQRGFHINLDSNIYVFSGTSGVGKTREAAELAKQYSDAVGNITIYLANGFVDHTTPLPLKANKKRIVLLIDDYDLGFIPADSSSFIERQAAHREALSNLDNIYKKFKKKLDLIAMIVTINTHRLPINPKDVPRLINDCSLIEVPLITNDEFEAITKITAKSLSISINQNIIEKLKKYNNGRIDTLSIFLSSVPKNTQLGEDDVIKLRDNCETIWKLFVDQLSQDQKTIYKYIKLLNDFNLIPRIEYIQAAIRSDASYYTKNEIQEISSTIWTVSNSVVITYSGQFPEPSPSIKFAPLIIKAALKSGKLRRSKLRYRFQKEMKVFCSTLLNVQNIPKHGNLLKKLCKWYPHDRYFSYLLASFYRSQRKYIRAILVLYRKLNRFDPRILISGKWIEVHLHVLLAELYRDINLNKNRNYKNQVKIEREYNIAIDLLTLGIKEDIAAKDYKFDTNLPQSLKEQLNKEHSELGLDIPSTISINVKSLLAMVHHKYSAFLLHEVHREYDALRHENYVTELIPEHGESFLACATAYLKIGNSQQALICAEKAERSSETYLDRISYDYLVESNKWKALEDLGNIESAKCHFSNCQELIKKEPLRKSEEFKRESIQISSSPEYWNLKERIADFRVKEFGSSLKYSVPAINMDIELPNDWKIERDHFDLNSHIKLFCAIFSSQANWDVTTGKPMDATVDMSYSTRKEDLSMDIKSFATLPLNHLSELTNAKLTLLEIHEPTKIENIVYNSWAYHIPGNWPKCGVVFAFELPNSKVRLGLMCAEIGKKYYKSLFVNAVEHFTKILLGSPDWKFDKNLWPETS